MSTVSLTTVHNVYCDCEINILTKYTLCSLPSFTASQNSKVLEVVYKSKKVFGEDLKGEVTVKELYNVKAKLRSALF